MNLLREIQSGAADDATSVASLLRKVKVLSARLGVPDVGAWATKELDGGYDSLQELPPYRGPFKADVRGDVLGQFGGGYKNHPVPPLMFDEDLREGALFTLTFFQTIAELEDLISRRQDLQEPWPADALALIERLQEGGVAKWDRPMHWIGVHKVIPHGLVVSVVDAVRNRLLEFTLRLEEAEPAAVTEEPAQNPDRVLHVFNTTVYASGANVAIGNRDVEQTLELPAAGDESGLVAYLRSVGLDEETLDELRSALSDDRDEAGSRAPMATPGRRVLAWLKRLSHSAGRVGSGVAVGIVTQAVLHYFGI